MAEENLCLGGVCLGDSIDKLKSYTWLSGDQLNRLYLPGGIEFEVIRQMAPTTLDPNRSYSEGEKSYMEKYALGITGDDRVILNAYYRSFFFDNKALDALEKVIACKGKKLTGFKKTKDDNVDLVTILTSPNTGKFEVVTIARPFPGIDKPQEEQLLVRLKEKYPSIQISQFRVELDNPQDQVVFWDEDFNTLNLTKVSPNTEADENDDKLLRTSSCSAALTTRNLNID